MRCWLNGRLLPLSEARVPVEDRGFLYGETLFETLRVHRGQPLQLDEHLQRLQRGAEQLGFKLPIAVAELAQAARDLPALQPLDEGVLRITLSRGSAARGLLPTGLHSPQLLITVAPLPPTLAQRLRDGVRLHTSQWRRCSPQMLPGGLKIGHYLGQVLALQEAVAAGADEALMLDAHDQLCEASSANLFLVEGEQLLTPELSTGALDGVTRRLLIELAPTLGLRVVQTRLERTRLAGADEVFLSSSVAGITPVAAIDGLRWSAPGPCTQALTRCYRQALSFKLEAAPC